MAERLTSMQRVMLGELTSGATLSFHPATGWRISGFGPVTRAQLAALERRGLLDLPSRSLTAKGRAAMGEGT